jgi:hypothetical protein
MDTNQPFEIDEMVHLDNLFNLPQSHTQIEMDPIEPLFPWDNILNTNTNTNTNTNMYNDTIPIIHNNEIITDPLANILETMTSPSVLNSNLDKEVCNNFYMNTLYLIQKAEIMLGNKNQSYDINKKETIQFINSNIAMQALNVAMEYKKLLGENQTYQYLLDKMKPFDGSMQQIIYDKENKIKQLQVELDLYKLKSTQVEKNMIQLRNVYETRRKEDYLKAKAYLQESMTIRNRKAELESGNLILNSLLKQCKKKYSKLKRANTYAKAEVLYQKKQKIESRKQADKLKTQLIQEFNDNTSNKKIINDISKRVDGLSKVYPGLKYHFKDLFQNNTICDCSICMDSVNKQDSFHICSNLKCGLVFHTNCLQTISKQLTQDKNKCPCCKVKDPDYSILLKDVQEKDDDYYESDSDDEFILGNSTTHITERDINTCRINMFLTDEERLLLANTNESNGNLDENNNINNNEDINDDEEINDDEDNDTDSEDEDNDNDDEDSDDEASDDEDIDDEDSNNEDSDDEDSDDDLHNDVDNISEFDTVDSNW